MALTATATGEVRRDITRCLKFAPSAATFKTSFFRSNLHLRVCQKPGGGAAEEILVAYLRKLPRDAAGIVYCSSRKQCEAVAAMLEEEGVNAGVYHAGLTPKRRFAAQAAWQAGARPPVCSPVRCTGCANSPVQVQRPSSGGGVQVKRRWWWPQSPLAWASIRPTCAWSCTGAWRRACRGTFKRLGARAATACPPSASCFTATATSPPSAT